MSASAAKARSPDFAKVVGRGHRDISLNPDTVVETWLYLPRKCRSKHLPSATKPQRGFCVWPRTFCYGGLLALRQARVANDPC